MDAVETVGWRDDLRAVDPVLIEPGIVLARPPRGVHALGGYAHGRRQRNDGTRIEIAIGPAIEAFADAVGKGIVDG